MTAQKIPFSVSINSFVTDRLNNFNGLFGKILPVSVAAVDTVNSIVTVNFEIDTGGVLTLPQVQCPIIGSQYIRIPVQVGDYGIVIAADTRLGGITGLGDGVAPLSLPSNLGALVFVPIGNSGWAETDPDSLVLSTPNGGASIVISPSGITVEGSMDVTGNLSAGNGITASFTTPTGQTVTVENGIVTNIY
jgi:hypothetical protein